MADATHTQGFYRQVGGNRAVVASSGSLDVESGGEIDVEAGGRLEIAGTALITSGGQVDLSSARNWTSTGGIFTAGPVKAQGGMTSTGVGTFDSVTSTGGTVGSGKFNSVTSTGTGTFNAVTSTGTGTFNAVTSTGTGTFNAVTSTGTGTFNAVTSTGTGTFNAVTSTGTGTFNAVTSTGTGTFNAVSSTGQVSGGFVHLVETVATTVVTALSNYGVSILGSSSLAEQARGTIVPIAGARKTFIVVSSVTSAAIEILTTGTWDGTNNLITVATTSGATETRIEAVASSTARWRLLFVTASSNYGLSSV